jgi:hypothetical protein
MANPAQDVTNPVEYRQVKHGLYTNRTNKKKDVTNSVSFPSFYCTYTYPVLFDPT